MLTLFRSRSLISTASDAYKKVPKFTWIQNVDPQDICELDSRSVKQYNLGNKTGYG